MTDPFARLGAFMVRWRWVVLAVWLVLLVVVESQLPPVDVDDNAVNGREELLAAVTVTN